MSKEEFNIKVGDKVIANDEFHRYGFIDGEVIEITPYKDGTRMSNGPSFNDNKFGVTILGRFKGIDSITDREYEYVRRVCTCDFKINPKFDVNIDWTCYGSYAKALFFTSKEIKDEFNEMIRNQKMEYHLSMAKVYGYKEKQI
jgi:hypothetical protein